MGQVREGEAVDEWNGDGRRKRGLVDTIGRVVAVLLMIAVVIASATLVVLMVSLFLSVTGLN